MVDVIECDVCVIGAGLAGLAAARSLHGMGFRVLVLEKTQRPGGRMHAGKWGNAWYNLGTQYIGGASSPVAELARSLSLDLRPIIEPTVALYAHDHLIKATSQIAFAMRFPISLPGKISLIGTGLRLRKMRKGLFSKNPALRAAERTRLESIPFSDLFVGSHPVVQHFFRDITEMMTSTGPENVSAYLGLLFTPGIGEPRGEDAPADEQLFAVAGGTDEIAIRISHELAPNVLFGCSATQIEPVPDGIRIETKERSIVSRSCIIATPSEAAGNLIAGIYPDAASTLHNIGYGSFVTVALHVKGVPKSPWENLFHIELEGKKFHIINHLTLVQDLPADESVFVALAASDRATNLLRLGDEELVQIAQTELLDVFPHIDGNIVSSAVGRWPIGLPFWKAGTLRQRDRLTSLNEAIILAGDYMDYPNMQGAFRSGKKAAHNAQMYLNQNSKNN